MWVSGCTAGNASIANMVDSECVADTLAQVIEKEGFMGMAQKVVGLCNLGLLLSGSRWWCTIWGIGSDS